MVQQGDAVCVHILGTVGIADIKRINGSNLGSIGPDVGSGAVGTIVAQGVEFELGVGHVGTNLQPVLGLVVGLQTTGQTGVVRFGGNTLVVQVAQGRVEGEPVLRTGHGEGVFLTDTLTVSLLGPVVGLDKEVSHHIAFGSSGIKATVAADGILSGRDGVSLVTQTATLGPEQVFICTHIGLVCRKAESVGGSIIVIEGLVVLFVVATGIRDGFVFHEGAGVHTHLGIEGNQGLSHLTLLGGDHDHTIGTTGAVQGIGGRILENGHGLDITGSDIVHVSVKRNAVHNDKRVFTCVD